MKPGTAVPYIASEAQSPHMWQVGGMSRGRQGSSEDIWPEGR